MFERNDILRRAYSLALFELMQVRVAGEKRELTANHFW